MTTPPLPAAPPPADDELPVPILPPRSPGWAVRLSRVVRDALRLEDVLLIIWVAVQPVLLGTVGGAAGTASVGATGGALDVFGGHDLWLGLVEALAVTGALLCLATRPAAPAGGAPIAAADRGTIGPLTGGLLLVGAAAAQNLVGDGDAAFLIVLVAVGVASLVPGVMPAIPIPYRRVLVTPYILVSASLFNGLMSQLGGLFDLHGLFDNGAGPALAALPAALGILVAFCGVYYLMLVYAPRQLAQAEGGLLTWLTRFAVFVVAEIIVTSWLAGSG